MPTAGPQVANITDADDLDDRLMQMNESGVTPVIPFVDANGFGSIAYGTAPSGDDWVVDLAAPRDPDSGNAHCCQCLEHHPRDCDSGAAWKPRYPLTGLIGGWFD